MEKEKCEMSHLRTLALSGALLIALAVPSALFAVDPEPYIESNRFTSGSGSVYVGCTLGDGWSGFPDHLMPDFTSTNPTEKLDVTLPLYVTWILYEDSTAVSQAVNPPRPITDFAWFNGFHDEFQVVIANPEPNNWLYNSCGGYRDFETPKIGDYPLDSDGQLHLEDVHGGIGTTSDIIFVHYTDEEQSEGVELHLSWSHPATRYDFVTQDDQDFTPGEVWRREKFIPGFPDLHITYDVKIVEWVSTDYRAITPGLITAADFAYFLMDYGNGGAVRWGFASESPANSPTFMADVTNVNYSASYLDGGDLAHASYDLGREAACQLGKPGNGVSWDAIMAWFGFARTGQMIDIGIATVPEWTCTNPEQRLIGINDPYGYRRTINSARSVPWGEVKELYR
jgi:hypothetical protein